MTELKERGRRYAVVDAITDTHLISIGEAAASHALLTGGSGVAMGLPANFRRAGLLAEGIDPAALQAVAGASAVVAGSCSRATLAQIGYARDHVPVFELDALATPDALALSEAALAWATDKIGGKPVVIAASAPPDKVAALQSRLGRDAAGALIEDAVARIAEGLVARGVRRIVVAGGETSAPSSGVLACAACASAPRSTRGCHGPCRGRRARPDAGAEIGNFGATDFFLKAFRVLEG